MNHRRHRGLRPEELVVGAVTVLGVTTGLAFLYGLVVETSLGLPARPFELAFLALPSVGLLAAAHWLRASGLEPSTIWRVGQYAVSGAIVATAVIFLAFATGRIGGVDRSGLFVLLIGGAGEGALLGVLGGMAAVIRSGRSVARSTDDRMAVLHKLLQHNLRNRINVIAGQTSLLEATSESGSERLASIETQLDAMLALLDDARIAAESASSPAETTRIDLSDMLDRCVDLIEATYPDARVETDYPDGVSVLADELLEGALENVLDNAVRHSDRDEPAVTVSLTRSDETVQVAVADDGPGIPDDRKATVFEENPGATHGLGLFLTRALVERHGGTIRIEDNEPRGTVVVLELPRAPA